MAARPNFTYKQLQEHFVSNTNGTSVLEVSIAMSVLPTVVILRDCLLLVSSLSTSWFKLLFDFLIVIVITELSFTVFSDHILLILLVTFLTIILLLAAFTPQAQTVWTNLLSSDELLQKPVFSNRDGEHLKFITYSRSCVNIATAICILAVDFPIFPRRFAKAETYGTGMMDTGVGLFVISNALISPEARYRTIRCRSLLDRLSVLFLSMKSCVPLLTLGLSRLMVVKGTEYQEHVTEYGVHWNFFFTLAAVKILSTFFFCVCSGNNSWVVSVFVCGAYQWCLHSGLEKYILHGWDGQGTRKGLLDANREGIFSSLGYVALYFAGVQLGRYLFASRKTLFDWLKCMQGLTGLSMVCWLGLRVCRHIIGPVSRRLANFPYVIWIIALCSQVLAIFLAAELVTTLLSSTQKELKSKKSRKKKDTGRSADIKQVSSHSNSGVCLLDAINYNGLVFFLTSNLLTGVVNLAIKTLYTPTNHALAILIVYMFISCIPMTILRYYNIALKFW